jgi:hypothetical protein
MTKEYLPTVEDAKEIRSYLIADMEETNNPETIQINKEILSKLSDEEVYFLFWLLEFKYKDGFQDAVDEFYHSDSGRYDDFDFDSDDDLPF